MDYRIDGRSNFLISEPGRYFPEKLTYSRWLSLKGRSFRNTRGELLILDPGKLNPGGPDFIRALLFLNGQILRGSVEIHRSSSDWYAHAHHLNPEYDDVVLQIVFSEENPPPVISFCGRKIPSFFLDLSTFPAEERFCPASTENLGDDFIRNRLQELGDRRIERHITRFLRELQDADFENAFYTGMCDAMGYGTNRNIFNLIPRIIPLKDLKSLLSRFNREIRKAYPEFLHILRRYNQENSPVFSASACRSVTWKRGGFRPSNHPFRRLATLLKAMDSLLFGGFRESLIQYIALEPSPYQYIKWLKKRFKTEVFIPGMNNQEIIPGAPRLIETSVNILLPLLIADSRLNGGNMEKRLYALLRQLPPGERITRYASRLCAISPSARPGSALEWQGLIHLCKDFCEHNHCQICPLTLF